MQRIRPLITIGVHDSASFIFTNVGAGPALKIDSYYKGSGLNIGSEPFFQIPFLGIDKHKDIRFAWWEEGAEVATQGGDVTVDYQDIHGKRYQSSIRIKSSSLNKPTEATPIFLGIAKEKTSLDLFEELVIGPIEKGIIRRVLLYFQKRNEERQ